MRYPLDGDINIQSPFGMRENGMHWGVDLYAMPGTPAYAVDSGQVFYAAYETAGGNHLAMYLDHPPVPEAPKAGYMHLDRFAVGPGTHVNEGDLIGWTDTTGAGLTGPHLHFWMGVNANTGAIDPMPYIGDHPGPLPDVQWIDSNLALDFSSERPSVADLIRARVAIILVYSRVSTPPRAYLDECMAFGIGVCPIFETAGTRPWEGYDAGRADGDLAEGDLTGMGVPDGVRCYVNMSDTPNAGGHEYQIADYAKGFAETFPDKWKLGSYGPLTALRASQHDSDRFDALWGVETWGSPVGTVQDHWDFFRSQPGITHVQMANVPAAIPGTDTNWICDRDKMSPWGYRQAPSIDWGAINNYINNLRAGQGEGMATARFMDTDVTDFVDKDGNLRHSARGVYGIWNPKDEVIIEGICDPDRQPTIMVHDNLLAIYVAHKDQHLMSVTWDPDNGWRDTDANKFNPPAK